jgi:NTP pyrophosphatase (non-canonical NTP hydrolase)
MALCYSMLPDLIGAYQEARRASILESAVKAVTILRLLPSRSGDGLSRTGPPTPPTPLGSRASHDADASTESPLDIRDAQKRAWENKLSKGFNTDDVPLEFGLLTAEVGEAFTAWRKRLPDFGEELADVALYIMAIAEMNGIDLDTEIDRKIAKNAGRTYERDEHGVPHRIGEA